MAKVIYGVAGEGAGHSSRAQEIVQHLQNIGHKVVIVSYGQGVKNLSGTFDVVEAEGLYFSARDNKLSIPRTIRDNLARLPRGGKKALRVRKLFKEFQPDCVITDFEPLTAYFANRYDLPLVTIDNQHRMRYMSYPCPRSLKADAIAAETVIRAMVPRPDVSLVTTFYFGEVKNKRTFLFPPILRKEVLRAKPASGSHILVYLTRGFETLIKHLSEFPREDFIVYGAGRNGKEAGLTFKGPSRDGFLRDLLSCKAVIATAGFTLMTEALHLHKPYMALPMKGQFEQELNGLLLADKGCGKNSRRTTAEAVGDFLYRVPDYMATLKAYPSRGNKAIKDKVTELLADGARLASHFHINRRKNSTL